VANGHSGISFLEKIGNRFANDVTPAEDHSTLPGNIDFRFFEENHNTFWGAGNKVRFPGPFCQFSDVEGVETVDVFEGRDG